MYCNLHVLVFFAVNILLFNFMLYVTQNLSDLYWNALHFLAQVQFKSSPVFIGLKKT